jgi:hypothetical protein
MLNMLLSGLFWQLLYEAPLFLLCCQWKPLARCILPMALLAAPQQLLYLRWLLSRLVSLERLSLHISQMRGPAARVHLWFQACLLSKPLPSLLGAFAAI